VGWRFKIQTSLHTLRGVAVHIWTLNMVHSIHYSQCAYGLWCIYIYMYICTHSRIKHELYSTIQCANINNLNNISATHRKWGTYLWIENIYIYYIPNYLLTSLFIFFKGGLAAQQRVAVARSTAFVTLLIRQCKAKYGGRTFFGSMGTTKLFWPLSKTRATPLRFKKTWTWVNRYDVPYFFWGEHPLKTV